MFSDIAYILLFYSTAVYDYQQQFMKHSGNLKALMCLIFFNESLSIIKIYLLRKDFYMLKKTSLFSIL